VPFDETTIALALPRKYLRRYHLLFAKAFVVCISTVVWKLQSPDQSVRRGRESSGASPAQLIREIGRIGAPDRVRIVERTG
jgi:hypothetical protein